ncbi:MAG: 5'-nucleotidase C-terminal domain-containing protein [Holophagales bacterium]|jgi:2',3'-cyclic-nucleotide 2'-phosphodiesterase/3'-nucleotidase|nr:5'-nucleotidase C-terminal domain-containing protein [Holophagales bacterium]
MLFRRLFVLISISISFLGAQGVAEQKIQILATADTRAEVLPMDIYSLSPVNMGWAKLASAINDEKRKNQATLLVDCGDMLQGAPMAYIQNRMRPNLPNPIIEIMNTLGYAAAVTGIHDFDFGLDALKKAEKEARFPFIAANLVDSNGKPIFKPFAKISVEGVSVALLGLFAPAAPNILNLQNQPAPVVRGAVETAKEWVPRLRNEEKADLVIAVVHTGAEGPRVVPKSENTAFLLVENVPGLDAVVASQSHQPLATNHNGVPIVQPSPCGQSIASITFTLQRQKGRWIAQFGVPKNIPLDPASSLDPQTLQITEILRFETESYLNTYATQLNADIDGRWSTVEPTPLVQLIHDVQRKATGAQLSAASSPGTHIFIPKGATSVRQFYALAPHENRVARIRITGAQLKAYLEHAATYFNYSYLPDLINRAVPLADYDMISGCSYALDISRPPGKRVTNLKFEGSPVQDDQVFTMAISSYRLAGGGGYMDAIGFNGRHETISREPLRNLLLDYVLAPPTLNLCADSNWRTIPSLDRERVVSVYK